MRPACCMCPLSPSPRALVLLGQHVPLSEFVDDDSRAPSGPFPWPAGRGGQPSGQQPQHSGRRCHPLVSVHGACCPGLSGGPVRHRARPPAAFPHGVRTPEPYNVPLRLGGWDPPPGTRDEVLNRLALLPHDFPAGEAAGSPDAPEATGAGVQGPDGARGDGHRQVERKARGSGTCRRPPSWSWGAGSRGTKPEDGAFSRSHSKGADPQEETGICSAALSHQNSAPTP